MTGTAHRLAGVCGWPVHHSLSPLIHNFWLREMGIDGIYVPFAVRPDEAEHAFTTLPRTSIVGVNVTMPLKAAAFRSARRVTPEAQKLGVANCLVVHNGELVAHNTDLEGFAAPLLTRMGAQGLTSSSCLMFGAGGAARAAIEALIRLNCPEIGICARSDDKAQNLAREVGLPSVNVVPWAARQTAIERANIIINATAAGMTGNPPLDVRLAAARPDSLVYDLVYTPLKTPLLAQAEKYGLSTLSGLDMLIAQARPSFRMFFGKQPPASLDPKPLLIRALGGEPETEMASAEAIAIA